MVFRDEFHYVDADVVIGLFARAVPDFSVRHELGQVYTDERAWRHKTWKAQLEARHPDIENAGLR